MTANGSTHKRRVPRGIFLNTAKANCSIFESGRMVYECLTHSDRYTLDYLSLDMIDTALFAETGCVRRIDEGAHGEAYTPDCDFWVINWHFITMAMQLPVTFLDKLPGLKFSIVLELAPDDPLKLLPADKFDGFIALEPDVERTATIFPFPRPLEGEPRQPRRLDRSGRPPVIGSFGFDTPGKGFELLIEAVNREFDEATVRINVPFGSYTTSTYTIHDANYAQYVGKICKRIAKPGVEVVVTHDFNPPEAVIDWCAENDLNCFMYTRRQPGLSATTDQAILSGRPLLTLGNDTFRHIHPYIPAYPEISLKRAISTTTDAVLRMQRDWSKERFRETFEEMLAAFRVLSSSPAHSGPLVSRRVGVLHAHMDGAWQDDIVDYATRLRDALGRTGNWQVRIVPCSSPDELRAMAAVFEPEVVIVSGADTFDRTAVSDALDDVAGPKIVVTDDVASWFSTSLAPFPRRPIIPFFTVYKNLYDGPPTIWLIGFGDPASSLEQAITKTAAEMPAATILVEAAPNQMETVASRIGSLRPALADKPSIDVQIRALPAIGADIIHSVAPARLAVIHNDATRARQIESYASLSMITERAVVFTRTAAEAFGGRGVIFEDNAVPAMIEMGIAAHVKLLGDFGEWQIAAGIRALCRKLQSRPTPAGFAGKRNKCAEKTAAYILALPGDRAFIHAVYWALLGRAPDPHGLKHFLCQVRDGRRRGSVLLDIRQSEECRSRGLDLPGIDAVASDDALRGHRTAAAISAVAGDDEFLHAAYPAALGRPPDGNGLAHFLAQLASGRGRGSILLDLSRSDEARARGVVLSGIDAVAPDDNTRVTTALEILTLPSDQAFLHAAYWALLGRSPDSDAFSNFLPQLDAGRRRVSVLVEIAQSTEARDRGAELPGIDALVTSAQASPIATADDILSLAGDEAFIDTAYRMLLGRAPDPGGFGHFVSQLREGRRRGAVLLEISQSPEAQARAVEVPGLASVTADDDGPRPHAVAEVAPQQQVKPSRTAAEILSIGDDATFIGAAYEALLGRSPDADGASHFLCQLREGRRRASILIEISESPEARQRRLELPGLDMVRRRERHPSASPQQREIVLRCALRSADNWLHRLRAEAATAAAGSLRSPQPLRFAPPTKLPAIQQRAVPSQGAMVFTKASPPAETLSATGHAKAARNATDRCIFLLVGAHGTGEPVAAAIRELSESWNAHARLRMVQWDTAERKLRFIDGESRRHVEKDACPQGSWLFAPQRLRAGHDTTDLIEVDAIMHARRLGLRTAFVFHGADPLRRPEDAGPAASAFDSYMQALLLADVVIPVSRDAEEDLVAVFTRHHLADWGPVVQTVNWPGTEATTRQWSQYAGSLDSLLRRLGNPARRIRTVYYWIDDAAAPQKISFSLELARTLTDYGVSLIPAGWNAASSSLTNACGAVAPGPILWADWIDPAATGAPGWVLATTGMTASLREALNAISSAGIRVAVLTDRRPGESLDMAGLSDSQRAEFQAMTRADKVLALSEAHYRDIYNFLLSWRGKVHSAEDRFKILPAPNVESASPLQPARNRTRPTSTKAILWATNDRPDVVVKTLRAAEQAASRVGAPLSLTVAAASGIDLPVDDFRSLEVVRAEPAGLDGALTEASFAVHTGRLGDREADVVRCLWHGIPCLISGTLGESPSPLVFCADFDRQERVAAAIGALIRQEAGAVAKPCWIEFARKLLTELATDRLRDACNPLPKSDKDIHVAFPNLMARRPKLSVCLSTYNRAGWVKRNLENIYSQISSERDDLEVFVVDNTSPDNTPEVIEPYRRKRNFRYHRNAQNVGMLGNLAVTAQRARGEYIWILGDDDLTRAGCINKVLDVLHTHPGIGLVYLNYGYTSEPDPLGITDLPAFLDAYNVLEPACPDEFSTVRQLAPKNENFYTAIYSHVYRRDHAMRSYCQDTSGRPFSSMLTCIPTSYYVLNYMPDEPAYWIGEPSVVVNSRVSWIDYGTLFDLEQLPRAWDLAERNGADGSAVDRRRANRLWLVAMMWKDIFENDRANNTPWFSASRVLMRLKHLAEIERYIPEMRDIYTRAHRSGHPGASMPPDELFTSFV